jgi:uncharacterized membrane protein YhaH (DUF805 family)
VRQGWRRIFQTVPLSVFVPVIGGLWYLIECGFLRGTPGPNAYGPDPLAAV